MNTKPLPIYCYTTGPIDFFAGSMSRSLMTAAFIDAQAIGEVSWEGAVEQLQQFENYAAQKFREIGWEGDHRGDSPRFFALPNPSEASMAIGVIYKQDNNGTCFIASPVPLPYLDENR